MAQRDATLDYIKGIGCIFMVLSHAIVTAPGWWYQLQCTGFFLGRMAPVIFFSVTGIVNTITARRYPLRYFLIFGTLFGLYGLTYHALWDLQTLQRPEFDIPELTGVTIIATVLVTRYAKKPLWGYVAVVAAVLGLHYGLVHFVYHGHVPDVTADVYPKLFPFSNFLVVPAVFAPIPWLVFAFVGNIFYQLADRVIYRITGVVVTVTLVSLAASLATTGGVLTPFWTDKWSMPVGFLLVSLSAQCLLFAVLRWGKERMTHPAIIYIGINSFPFLFLHIMWLQMFYSLGQHHIALLWSGTLTLTLGSMVVFDRLNATWLQPRLQSAAAWGVVLALLAVGLALPCFPAVPALLQTHVIRIAGLIFAYNYKSLAAVVKRYTVPKTVPAVPIPTPS